MRRLRFYTAQPLAPGAQVQLEAGLARRLGQVLRLKPGTGIFLFDGTGLEYAANIHTLKSGRCLVEIGAPAPAEAKPRLDIHLGLGISRGERMDFALQKATELGISQVSPLLCQHQALHLDRVHLAKKEEHWRGILISASEQSGRCWLPGLAAPVPLVDWTGQAPEALRLLLDPEAGTCLDQIEPPEAGWEIRLLVGPEGGLSQEELALARGLGFRGIRLGPRVLRTETAPLAAIAAMQMLWGDFSAQAPASLPKELVG